VTTVAAATENRTGKEKRNVQPVVLDDEVLAVKERLLALEERRGRDTTKERVHLTHRLEILETRQRRVREMVGALPGLRSPDRQPGSVPMGAMPVR